ncbi:unnamed protein product [Sphagnum balticum]
MWSSLSFEASFADPNLFLARSQEKWVLGQQVCRRTEAPWLLCWTPEVTRSGTIYGSARLVQWYLGHIAKAKRLLKEQLKLMDVAIKVQDALIPMAITHPEIDTWIGDMMRILVVNWEDMISSSDKNA